MKLFKMRSGVKVDDAFTSLNGWVVSDNSKVDTTNGLNIDADQFNDVTVSTFIDSDVTSYVAFIDYTPLYDGDDGGMRLFNSNDEAVELLEFYKEGMPSLEEVRITRDGNTWTMEMKRDGEYEHIDSFEYPFKNIGFIRKPSDNGVPFTVSRFIGTTSRTLTINQLPVKSVVTVITNDGETEYTADEDEKVEIVLEDNYINGTIKVTFDGELLLEREGEYFGGDIYSFGTFLEMVHDDEVVEQFDPHKLGRVTAEGLLVKLELYNPSDLPAVDVKVKVEQYNSAIGYDWTDISLNENGPFDKSVTIPLIEPKGKEPYWILIQRDSIVPEDNLIYFTIHVEHS